MPNKVIIQKLLSTISKHYQSMTSCSNRSKKILPSHITTLDRFTTIKKTTQKHLSIT